MSTLLRGIGHVAVATADLDRLVAFYRDVFEAEVTELHGGAPRHCFIRVGEATVLHAFERPEAVAAGGRPWTHGPVDHFTLEAAGLEAFVELRERLRARGCAADAVTDFGSLVSVFFTDPDGLLLELSLWKPPGFEPPFETTPFRGRAGAGGDAAQSAP